MKDVHQRAARATRFQEGLLSVLAIWLVIVALGWLAIRGDDIRAARQGITVEELDQRESHWADHPNDSRCSWSCVERSYEFADGEVWE